MAVFVSSISVSMVFLAFLQCPSPCVSFLQRMNLLFCNKSLAIERFELSTLALLARCSNRLSYTAVSLNLIQVLSIFVANGWRTASWFSFLHCSKTTMLFSYRTFSLRSSQIFCLRNISSVI